MTNLTPYPGTDYPGVWDVEYKYQTLAGDMSYMVSNGGGIGSSSSTYAYATWLWSRGLSFLNRDGERIGLFATRSSGSTTYGITAPDYITKSGDTYGYYQIVNWSNKRNTTTIQAWGDDLTGWKSKYYVYYTVTGTGTGAYTYSYKDQITDTLDVRDSKYYRLLAANEGRGSAGSTTTSFELRGGSSSYPSLYNTIWYYFKVWKNFYLENYYIPLPKGTWLPDGRQLPYNTFYDIINNIWGDPISDDYIMDLYALGADHTQTNNKIDYFTAWNYNSEDINLIGKCIQANCPGYQYPDELSNQIATYANNEIMPLYKTTADTANHVQGTWYFNGYAWIPARLIQIQASNSFDITSTSGIVALKGDTRNTSTTYNTYLNPTATSTSTKQTFTTETITNVYAISNNRYWSGKVWIPTEYTSNSTVAETKTYVVSVDYLNVYQYPIANDAYKVSQLQSGDRITSNAALTKDEYWKQININGTNYWIDSYNTTQELVQ